MSRITFFVIPMLFFYSACNQNNNYKEVNSQQFQELLASDDGILIDVRTESEFNNGHIANAGNLNIYSSDFNQSLLLLPKDQPIYLYCLSGNRSLMAARILAENGYKNVYNLQKGMMEWNSQNLPVVIESNAKPDTDNAMEPEQFANLIGSDSLVFIDFYAPWCGPCRKMMPMIDSLKVEFHGKVKVVKVNVDASKNLAKELKLIGVPYLSLYNKGEVIFSKNGTVTREELTGIFKTNIEKLQKK
jgi:thioredoxin 1